MTSPGAVADLLRTTAARADGYIDERPGRLLARIVINEPDELDRWRGVERGQIDAGLESCAFKDGDEAEIDATLDGNPPTPDAPLRITVRLEKAQEEGVRSFFTVDGLIESIRRHRLVDEFVGVNRVRVAGLESSIETFAFTIDPWDSLGSSVPLTPHQAVGDVQAILRTNDADLVPCMIGAWLPAARPQRTGSVAERWLHAAGGELSASLACEVWRQDGSVEYVLRGPLTRRARPVGSQLDAEAIWRVIDAARWVYELRPEAEIRHNLLVQELARMWPAGASWEEGLSSKVGDALEIARVAYSLHLGDASAESLRSLAELRRALADETTKIAGFSRELTVSLWRSFVVAAGAIVTNILVVQKENTPDLRWLGWPTAALIVLAYLFDTITQRHSIGQLHKSLREWRSRIFPYIADNDFDALGSAPLRRADNAYWVVWSLVLLLNLGLATVLVLIALGVVPLGEEATIPAPDATRPSMLPGA